MRYVPIEGPTSSRYRPDMARSRTPGADRAHQPLAAHLALDRIRTDPGEDGAEAVDRVHVAVPGRLRVLLDGDLGLLRQAHDRRGSVHARAIGPRDKRPILGLDPAV